MAITFDAVLGVLIPAAVFFAFGVLIYRGFGEEIKIFIRWIKKMMAPREEEQAPVQQYQSWYSY